MTDPFYSTSIQSADRFNIATQGGFTSRGCPDLIGARNEEELAAQAEHISPERAAELNDYYNRTLEKIDKVRYPGPFPVLSTANTVQQAIQEGKKRTDAAEMVAGDTPVVATAGEISSLNRSLSIVQPEILTYANERGVKFQPVHEGDDINALKVLRPRKPDDLAKKLPEMEAFGKKLNEQVEARFDSPLRKLEQERADLVEKLRKEQAGQPDPPDKAEGFAALFAGKEPSDPRLDKLDDDIAAIDREKGKFMTDEIKKSGLASDIKPFTIDTPSLSGLSGAGISAMVSMLPQSMESMAEIHGARTPEEKNEFYRAMEALNGDKLGKARQEAVENELNQLGIDDPQDREKAKEQIQKGYQEQFAGHPEKAPMNYQKSVVLVPNTYYYHKPGASDNTPPIRLDYHDYSTLNDWTDSKTGKANSGKLENGAGGVTNGQYFHLGGVNRILIRDSKMGDTTPVHELGHAVETNVEKDDPEFYTKWQENLKKAYDNVGQEGGTKEISDYSRTNLREYLAEGFLHYYEDPKLLNSRDPALYSRVEELVNRAASLTKKQ
ncbi:MAG: hypothetical protein AB9903_26240 [Vulcanimicrobiota bacterium]